MMRRGQICPNCQTRVKRGARWCHNCGTELPEPAAAHGGSSAPDRRIATPEPAVAPAERSKASALALALVLLLVMAVVATGLVIREAANRTVAPNGQETSDAARAAILDRTSAALQPALSYTAGTLAADLAAAQKAMTPAMAKKYAELLPDDARKGIADRGQAQTAKVEAEGLVSLSDSTAKVLVLLVETTTASGVSNQQVDARRLRVTMKKSGGTWLIDSMDPF